MSNAMSSSKSRWKGALLAAVATAVVTPLAANAQSMSVSVVGNPLGTSLPKTSLYIDPYSAKTLYVYATVTGTQAPSATYVDGLSYLYYNVNAVATGVTGLGTISSAALNSNFNGGNFNIPAGSAGNGAQAGNLSTGTYSISGSLAVGSTVDQTLAAKPRNSNNGFFWSSATGSGSNVVVSGNSVSFLVETLTYTPNSTAVNANPSAPGSANSVAFNVSIPSLSGSNYTPTNYFVGLPSTPFGSSPGALNTSSGYSASATSVKLTNALPGDANLDGTVNFTDLSTILQNYNLSLTGWANGDFNNDGVVNFTDLSSVLQTYNLSLGGPASGSIAVPSSVLADPQAVSALQSAGLSPTGVPEPTSLGLLAVVAAGSLSRRRR